MIGRAEKCLRNGVVHIITGITDKYNYELQDCKTSNTLTTKTPGVQLKLYDSRQDNPHCDDDKFFGRTVPVHFGLTFESSTETFVPETQDLPPLPSMTSSLSFAVPETQRRSSTPSPDTPLAG